jgi:hypothetical protein
MKTPGTPGRKIDNPLSPTFREEQILEKHEQLTEKEQARDLVPTENQDQSSDCKVLPSRCEFQLQSHRTFYAFDDFLDLQCDQSFTNEK